MSNDFDGCNYRCWKASAHTLVWGDCAMAPESARLEPHLTVLRHRIAEDGFPELVGEAITRSELAERIETALRTVSVTLGPNALAMLERGEPVQLSGGEYSAMALAVAVNLIDPGQ